MKEIKFKIIELAEYQVLLTKDFDNESDEDIYMIVISFFIDGVKVTYKYHYEKEKNRDDMFLLITDKYVQSLIDNAITMMLP